MAYCTKCGRPVPEGGRCTCTQTVQYTAPMRQPSQPQYVSQTQSQARYTAQPQQPVQPQYTAQVQQPAQPQYTAQAQQPLRPQYTGQAQQQVQPQYTAQVQQQTQPQYTAQVQQPAQPQYTAQVQQPAQPQYSAQAQPQYTAQVQQQAQPQYTAQAQQPVQSQYTAQVQQQTQPQYTAQVQYNGQPAYAENTSNASSGKKGKLVGIILGSVIGIVIISVLIFTLSGGNSGKTSGSSGGSSSGYASGNSSSGHSSGNSSGSSSGGNLSGSSQTTTSPTTAPKEESEPKRGTITFKNWARSYPEICEISVDTDYVWVEEEDLAMPAVYEIIEPANDEVDFMFANDYTNDMFGCYMYDSCGYEIAFGVSKPTLQDLYDAVDRNPNIDSNFKGLIKEYVCSWLTLWPDSDFTILYMNLENLVVEVMTEAEIQMAAVSPTTIACYLNQENKICLNEKGDFFNRESEDYIVFIHELTHAARTRIGKLDGKSLSVRFYKQMFFGLYEDEMLDTWFCYQIQGLNKKSRYYTFTSNVYRSLLPMLDYDGADYMNHSINYFMKCLQDYFDEIGYDMPAYRFITMVNARMEYHYDGVNSVGYNNYSDMFRLIMYSWGYNNLKPGMSEKEIEEKFQVLYEDLTYNFDKLSKTYDEITEDYLRFFWNEYLENNGWK